MLNINGIKKVQDVCDCGTCYVYFTDESINQNMFIIQELDEIGVFEKMKKNNKPQYFTSLTLIYCDDNGKAVFIPYYAEEIINDFVTYMAVKNVFDIYNGNTLKDFLVIMEQLSLGYTSSDQQPDEFIKDAMYTRAKNRIEEIKAHILAEH